MWVDGSALKAPQDKFYCGSGVVLIYKDKVKEISHPIEDGTVNIAELTAPILGLQCLKERCDVTIYSDSQYTINTQELWYDSWCRRGWMTQNKGAVKNKDLIQLLHSLCQQHNVKWVKVKSHSGLKYNDLADELAVRASSGLKERG